MLVDCTDLLSDTGAEPLDFVTMLRQEIYQKTKCTASAGLGLYKVDLYKFLTLQTYRNFVLA